MWVDMVWVHGRRYIYLIRIELAIAVIVHVVFGIGVSLRWSEHISVCA
jgi:hypothetical protein